MTALLHYPAPGAHPVGVWWLVGGRSRPKAYYGDSGWYTDGARAVLGADDRMEPISLASWESICERLAGTLDQNKIFTSHETTDPMKTYLDAFKS